MKYAILLDYTCDNCIKYVNAYVSVMCWREKNRGHQLNASCIKDVNAYVSV